MESKRPEAMRIVHRYMAVSAGAAFIPVAGADVVTLAGIHVALIKQLCDHYEVPFTNHTARNVLIAVTISIVPGTLGSIVGRRILSLLPAIGAGFGWMLMSAGSAAFSYVIGRLFIEHFEAGGTLDSFDASRLHWPRLSASRAVRT
jgi:uncharacterized protein (DUF697 family)